MIATPRGLSEEEARRRLATDGANEMPATRSRGFVTILFETMREPMFFLLIAAAVLYLGLGDLSEGLFLVGGAAATVGLVIVQEARSERALAALRELSQPRVRLVRDGVERMAASRELVSGDIVLVGEGERLPADGVLVDGEVLSVDESVLTGESAPVTKPPAKAPEFELGEPRPGAEASPLVFGGTLVVRGQGVVRVTATGLRSALGRIGGSLATIAQEQTPLQKTAGRLAGLVGGLALAFSAVVAVAYGVVRGEWSQGVLAGITIAISLIPEEFPMVLAVFMALGAWRLANHKVLVRRSAVIEALGAASVLCVDKTGTLTENQMQVARLWTPQGETVLESGAPVTGARLAGAAAEVVRIAVLASAVRPVDPMDKAVRALIGETDLTVDEADSEPRRSWPLRPERLAVVQLWRESDGTHLAAAKGAPEAIFSLCRLSDDDITRLHGVISRYAEQGLRVLGVACARGEGEFLADPSDTGFDFVGLIGFIDPLRADAAAALREARGAGVTVIMITGDHPATALAIARAAGLETEAGALTGTELARLPTEELRRELARVRVFARIDPEQKLRIVEALKASGEVVAMTGDGVNDAPALEAAHIGVSMGRRGADVAREASDLVLLDDSFASIVGGVRLGRRIFANLRRALTYVTAIHVPIAGLALAPVLMGLPPLLLPMHVVLLELVIDPTCALVFEAEPSEASSMRRPPRRRDEPLFGPRQLAFGFLQGLVILAAVLALYVWALGQDQGERASRGAAFLALVVGNMVLALTDSAASTRIFGAHRRTYWLIATAVALVLCAMMTLDPLAALFKVVRPAPGLLILALVTGVISGGWSVLASVRMGASGKVGRRDARTRD